VRDDGPEGRRPDEPLERRTVLAGVLSLVGLGVPILSQAQEPKAGRIWRIGWLSHASSSVDATELKAFRAALAELGYVEGRNITIEARWAQGDAAQLPQLARSLVEAKVDILCTAGTPASLAAKQATTKIPIVFSRTAFPERSGLVQSLARPGGNLTGVAFIGPEYGKRLELLREVSPKISRVALLYNAQNSASVLAVEETREWSKKLQVTLEPASVHDRASLDTAFGVIRRGRPDALMTTADAVLASYRTPIVEFASAQHLIGMYADREYVVAGGLMFYGTSLTDMWRHGAIYVDRILKGARPGELPVEQPTKFELVINRKIAKALSLTIPPAVLLRADEFLE
jgi:putative tryptophan/tyrosine transport system substrate-binding protein